MGNLEPRLVDLRLTVDEQVEVEGPRPVGAGGRAVATESGLEHEQAAEEVAWRQLGLERNDSVQKARLIDNPNRLGIDERGNADDLDARRRRELRDCCAERRLAVAEVGAEPDIRPGHGRETSYPARSLGLPSTCRGSRCVVRVRLGFSSTGSL